MTSANRKYKDSVFCKLFSDPERFLELYGAIEGKVFPKDTKIVETTLDNVLFMERRNDISFLIEDRLVVMVEHQSTINNNMPLRFLLYIAYIYENILESSNIYRTRLIKTPEPEFIVIYNGREFHEKEKVLSLSDAFFNDNYKQLELKVRVININENSNPEILKKSKNLEGYSKLVSLTEDLRKNRGMSLDEAVKISLKTCIDNDLLTKFILENYREVSSMLRTEFNLDDAKIIWRLEALEEGREEGEKKGREEGEKKGREEGEKKGREEGREEGKKEGKKEGREELSFEYIANLLKKGFKIEEISELLGEPVSKIEKVRSRLQTV